jgi:iron complex outermembrane receptor protein
MDSIANGRTARIQTRLALKRKVIALAVAAAFSGAACAADAAKGKSVPGQVAGETVELDVISVTSERRVENVQDIASSVSVIGGEKVTGSEVRNAGDVIRFVPNMTADTTDGHGRPKFYIRGIGLSDASIWNTNPIGTYNDDVYIWNASTVGFPLFDLERVEVLRGPQGTLWGKNTTGGAIHFISRKPSFEPDGYAKVSFGSYNNQLFEGAVGGAVNDVFAVRASVRTERQDLFTQNSYYPDLTKRWDDTGARFQVLGRFSDTLDANLNWHIRDFNGPVLTNGNLTVPNTTRFNVPSFVQSTDHLRQNGVTLTVNKLIGDLVLTSITGKESFSRLQTGGDAVPYQANVSRTNFSVDQFSQEFRLTSPKEDRLSWILGAYYFDGTLDSQVANGSLPGAVKSAGGPAAAQSYNSDPYTLKSTSYAVFGTVDYKVTPQFDVALGLRQTSDTKKDHLRYQTAPSGFTFTDITQWWNPALIGGKNLTTVATQDADKTWKAFTYDITPSYQVSDNVKVYFRHAKGFNGGSFNATATAQGQVATIDPEYLKSYELGTKTEWWNKRLTINAAAFYYDYTNIQQKSTILNPTNPLQQVVTFINAGGGYSRGVELEVAVKPIKNLTLAANIGYNQTEFTDFQDTPTHNAAGNWFNRVPQLISNFQADYKYPLANGAAVVLNTDWAYRSKSYFNAVDQTSPALIEPSYWLGNLSVGYVSANKKYEVRAFALNILDKQYRNTSLITGSYSYGPPRTVGISLSARI